MARTQSVGSDLDFETFVGSETPIALSIAGSDCSAGAGIQADLKAFTAAGVYGMTAVTAIVAETSARLGRIECVSTETVDAQLAMLFDTYPIAAVKTGMLPTAGCVAVVSDQVAKWKARRPDGSLVVDPVTQASTGPELIERGAGEALMASLLPQATLVTPNLSEAIHLTSTSERLEPQALGEMLAKKLGISVLLKGGHNEGDPDWVSDYLCKGNAITAFRAPRIPGGHEFHGTGCTLASAIAAHLARGRSAHDAIHQAKHYMNEAMLNPARWSGGLSALGPIDCSLQEADYCL